MLPERDAGRGGVTRPFLLWILDHTFQHTVCLHVYAQEFPIPMGRHVAHECYLTWSYTLL